MAGTIEDVSARDEDTNLDDNSMSANAVIDGQPVNFLQIIKTAEQQNQSFMAAVQRTSWQSVHRAYRNQHATNSKYASTPYRNRSKLFRPKIRSAIRRALSSASNALFSNTDVVSIKAEHDADPVKQASAQVIKEDLNYRLDRTSARSGIPWFLTAMGGALDAQIHGVVVSKQYWDYQTVKEEHDLDTPKEIHSTDESGQPMFDEMGQPITQQVHRERREYVIHDRPMIQLIPPENAMVDPAAPWYDPVQLSPYLCVKFPMTIDEAKAMIASKGKDGGPGLIKWLDVPDAVFKQASQDFVSKGVRVERSGGIDRYDNRDTAGNSNSAIVWMFENFVRIMGADYHFWSIGARAYASKIQPTRASYPEQFGNRPYTYGYAAIEPHTIAPMSPGEQLLPMQMEANDLVNLRMDAAKQRLSPIAKVRQGSLFDWKQLQHRGGADTTIIVRDPKDLEFEQMPGATMESYQEMSYLNNDMDELSGNFSNSSINSNRQLNETVGGLKLLSNSSSAIAEFDLRVWVETWIEPSIRQVVRLIQYYEDDQTILEIAGQRAMMFERFGVNQVTDRDLETEMSVKVHVGLGATDPVQRIQRMMASVEMIGKAIPLMKGMVRVKPEEFIREVMTASGYNDGTQFFEIDENQPSMVQLQMMMQMQLQLAKDQIHMKMAEARGSSVRDAARLNSIVALIDTLLSAKAAPQPGEGVSGKSGKGRPPQSSSAPAAPDTGQSETMNMLGFMSAMKMITEYFAEEAQIPYGRPPGEDIDPAQAMMGGGAPSPGGGGPPGAGGGPPSPGGMPPGGGNGAPPPSPGSGPPGPGGGPPGSAFLSMPQGGVPYLGGR